MNLKTFEKKEKNLAEMTVEIAADEFESALNEAYNKNRNQIAIPGFRKGKAPRKIVENTYGKTVFYEDALEVIMPTVFSYGVRTAEVETVGYPKILDVDFGDDKNVTVKCEVALYPTAEISDYKGLTAPKDSVEVSDDEVEEEVKKALEKSVRMVAVTRPAVSGDTANIDYEGFMDGKAFDGGKDEGYDLVLGSNSFIPGFEDQVIGLTAGTETEINVVFPEEYGENMSGKAATFKIKVNEVKEKVYPQLDDEFAKDVSEYDTLAEYKDSLKKEISDKKQKAADEKFEEAVMDALSEKLVSDIPDVMIDELVENQLDGLSKQLQSYGMDMNSYMGAVGSSVDVYRKSMRPKAEKDIKTMLSLEKVAEIEDFEVTEEDKEKKYAEYAEQYGAEVEKIKESIPEVAVIRDLKLAAARKFIIENAVVGEPAAKDEKAEAPKKKPAAKKPAAKKETATKKTAVKDDGAEKPAPKKAPAKKPAAKKAEETKE